MPSLLGADENCRMPKDMQTERRRGPVAQRGFRLRRSKCLLSSLKTAQEFLGRKDLEDRKFARKWRKLSMRDQYQWHQPRAGRQMSLPEIKERSN